MQITINDEVLYKIVDKGAPVIRSDAIGAAESIADILNNEANDLFVRALLKRLMALRIHIK